MASGDMASPAAASDVRQDRGILSAPVACLGLEARGSERKLVFYNPVLPEFLREVRIRRLRVGEACVDLLLTRHERGDIAVTVVRREGSVEVVVK